MILSVRRLAILTALFAGLDAASAAAQQAVPADRCSGTFCDFYYGGTSPEPPAGAQPAAPRPLMAPSGGILGFFSGGSAAQPSAAQPSATPGAATSSGAAQGAPTRRIVGVGGGGLAAMARGEAPERCTGTLCDFYYGGPPPEKPAQSAVQPVTTEQQAAAELAPEADPEPARPAIRYRPRAETKASCAPRPGDPWSCYR